MTDAPKQYRYKDHFPAIQWDGTKESLILIYETFKAINVVGNHKSEKAILIFILGKVRINKGDYIIDMGGSTPDVLTAEEFESDYEPVEQAIDGRLLQASHDALSSTLKDVTKRSVLMTKALHKIKDEMYNEDFDADYVISVVDSAISGEPVEPAAQGWISVEDRLPPVGIEVLVIDEYNNYSRDTIDEDSDGFSWMDDGEYTHWCELPKPPAREGDVLEPSESDIKKHEERLAHILAQAAEPRE